MSSPYRSAEATFGVPRDDRSPHVVWEGEMVMFPSYRVRVVSRFEQAGTNLKRTAAVEMSSGCDLMGVCVWHEPIGDYVKLALSTVANKLASV